MAGKKGIKHRSWTDEELEFLRIKYLEYDVKQLTALFNEQFGHNLSYVTIRSTLNRHKMHCGRSTLWYKGQPAHNKGKKWDDYMSKEGQANSRKTCFSKDRSINNSNHNELPVGTELITRDKYTIVKTDKAQGRKDRSCWILKHRLIYEQHYGEIPKGYRVIFADGDTQNFNIDNLILVKPSELCLMNKLNIYYKGCGEATKCGALIAKIKLKEKEVTKNGNKK